MYRDTSNLKRFGAIQYFLYIQRKAIAVLKPLSPIHGLSCKEYFNLNTTAVDTISFLHPVFIKDRFDVCFLLVNVYLNGTKYVVQLPSSLMFD